MAVLTDRPSARQPPRPGGRRAVCGWSAVSGCRDTSAPARPPTTWKITASWWIDPRKQGFRYHEAGKYHAIAGPIEPTEPEPRPLTYRGGQRSGPAPAEADTAGTPLTVRVETPKTPVVAERPSLLLPGGTFPPDPAAYQGP